MVASKPTFMMLLANPICPLVSVTLSEIMKEPLEPKDVSVDTPLASSNNPSLSKSHEYVNGVSGGSFRSIVSDASNVTS